MHNAILPWVLFQNFLDQTPRQALCLPGLYDCFCHLLWWLSPWREVHFHPDLNTLADLPSFIVLAILFFSQRTYASWSQEAHLFASTLAFHPCGLSAVWLGWWLVCPSEGLVVLSCHSGVSLHLSLLTRDEHISSPGASLPSIHPLSGSSVLTSSCSDAFSPFLLAHFILFFFHFWGMSQALNSKSQQRHLSPQLIHLCFGSFRAKTPSGRSS